MQTLIIGAAGFVGGYLIDHLLGTSHGALAVTKMPHETLSGTSVDVHDLDLLDKDAVTELIDRLRPDRIYHLAAQSSVALSWKNPGLTVDVNIKGTLNLLEAIRGIDGYHPRILLIGSGEEYGYIRPEETPVSENTLLRPGNIYAATKASQNMLGSIYARAYHMDIVMVRAFNHIGPNQAPIFVVADFCRQVAQIEAGKKEAVMSVGNLESMRDFTDVRDVVKAYALLIEKGRSGETYNVGSGHAVSIHQILSMILSHSTVPVHVRQDPARLRPSDIPIIEADIHKIREATGWAPAIPLEQTITETLNYWRNQM